MRRINRILFIAAIVMMILAVLIFLAAKVRLFIAEHSLRLGLLVANSW